MRSWRSQLQWPLAVGCAFVFVAAAACGGDDDDTGAAGTAGADGRCDDSDPVLLGVSLPLSGAGANVGEQFLQGVEYAVEVSNTDGGVLGRCVETVVKDDQGDPTRAAQVARELVQEESIDFMFGSIYSSPVQAQLPITTPAKVIHLSAGVLTESGDAETYPYHFRVSNSATTASEQFVQFIQEQGWDSVAILAVNNAFGTTSTDGLLAAIEGTDIDVVAQETMETAQLDVASQVRSLEQEDPDALVLFTTGADLAPPLNARADMGWDGPVLAYYTVAEEAIISAVGADRMGDVYAGQIPVALMREEGATAPSDERAAEFLANLKEHLGTDTLDQLAAGVGVSYDGVRMVVQAANDVGSLDSDELKAHLEENDYVGEVAVLDYTAERHDGIPLDGLAFGLASSLQDGTLAAADG